MTVLKNNTNIAGINIKMKEGRRRLGKERREEEGGRGGGEGGEENS